MSRYYRDTDGTWSRRLLALDGVTGKRFVDLSLTPSNPADGWDSIREEKIRVHRNTNFGKEFFDELPAAVKFEMRLFLGTALADRLMVHNFVDALGLPHILSSDLGGGVPAAEVRPPALWGQPLS